MAQCSFCLLLLAACLSACSGGGPEPWLGSGGSSAGTTNDYGGMAGGGTTFIPTSGRGGSAIGGSAIGGSAIGGESVAGGGSDQGGAPSSAGAGGHYSGGTSGGSPGGGSSGTAGTHPTTNGGTNGAAGASGSPGWSGSTSGEMNSGSGGSDSVSGGSGGSDSVSGGSGGSDSVSGGSAGTGGTGPEEDGPLWLGSCQLMDISDDGYTVLAREGLWNESTGWVTLPDLPGGTVENIPRVVSGDGLVVFGSSSSALGNEIYRWSADDGIQGLGVLYLLDEETLPLPPVTHSIDTNFDGSVLIIASNDGLWRWTAETGVNFIIDEWGDPISVGGVSGPISVILSADGSRIAHSGGYSYGPFWPYGPGSGVTTIGSDNPLKAFPTAVSGDGKVIAAAQWANSGTRNLYTGLDYTGNVRVGIENIFFTSPPQILAPFYRSVPGDYEFLSEALFRRGVAVDVDELAQPLLSTDGHTVVASGLRHPRDGGAVQECFIATFGDLDPEEVDVPPSAGTLDAPPVTCGNGVLDAGETCDDGNVNDADGCTARCARPKLSASNFGTCAVHTSGNISCWGELARPFVGTDVGKSWTATRVPALENVLHVANADGHSCAVLVDGRVQCWGQGDFGQLGNGDVLDSVTPVDVVGIADAIQVSVANESSCALVSDGTVFCWGAGALDPVATDASGDSAFPVEVSGLDHVTQIAVHGAVYCLANGCNRTGQAPLGACALRDDLSVWCWGAGPWAPGAPIAIADPRLLTDDARQIAPGGEHFCVLHNIGSAECWRWQGPTRPMLQSTLTLPINTVALASGTGLDCALLSDGRVSCYNYDRAWRRSREVQGTCSASTVPTNVTPVRGITSALHVAAGQSHACAALSDGSVRCWGGDDAGQLGIGHVYSNCPAGLDYPVSVLGLP